MCKESPLDKRYKKKSYHQGPFCRQGPNGKMKKCCRQGHNGSTKHLYRQGPNGHKHVTALGSGHCIKSTPEGSFVYDKKKDPTS